MTNHFPGLKTGAMSKEMSLYLDLVRLLAALIVMVYHFAYGRFTGGGLQFIRDSHIGSDAVIVFFVLSGFVIAYVTAHQDNNLRDYVINRLSRLWSVMIPALILTIVVDQIGQRINPAAYDGWWYQADSPIVRSVANLFFLNEIWFKSIRPFTNGPFWSLSYEFWYYAIFAAAFYFRSYWRVIFVLSACMIAGPKILLLLPVWLLGVLTWHISKRLSLSLAAGIVLFLVPIEIYILIKHYELDKLAFTTTKIWLGTDDVGGAIGFSDEFLISYIYGVLIAMNFLGFQALGPYLGKLLNVFEGPIRFCAGLTFSIYLFHYPLFQFFSAVLSEDMNLLLRNSLMFILSLLVIAVVGHYTERKKYVLRRILDKLLICIKPRQTLAK